MIKFKIDENLPIEVADLLKHSGYDTHTVFDEFLQGASDDTLFAAAFSEKRIFVTLDLDFADIRKYDPSESSGIIVLRIANQSKSRIIDLVNLFLPLLKKENVQGKLWIVEHDKIRIRS